MYGLVIGNFDKGPIGVRTYISSSSQADIVLGKPKVGSDIAYYSMHSFLYKSKRLWAVRVADNTLYGGMRVGAMFNVALGTGNGTNLSFSGTLPFGRCLPGTVEIYVDFNKVGYDTADGDIDGTDLGVSTVNYKTGAVSLLFTEAPPVGAVVYARWGLGNAPLETGLADPEVFDFDDREIELELDFTLKVYSDTLVPYQLVPPSVETVTSEANATVKLYDGDTLIAYADENGDFVDMDSYLDGTATNEINYSNGTIGFTLDDSYTPTNPLTAKYFSYKADLFIVLGDNPGSWTDDYYVLISRIDTPNNNFEVTVFERNERNVDFRMESYNLSREFKQDGYKRQMNLEERVNDKSYYIRFKDNPYIAATEALPNDSLLHNHVISAQPTQLASGDAGTAPSVATYINALKTFNNKEDVKVDIIIDTLSDRIYQLEIAKLADRELGGRGDCYGVLYVPYD